MAGYDGTHQASAEGGVPLRGRRDQKRSTGATPVLRRAQSIRFCRRTEEFRQRMCAWKLIARLIIEKGAGISSCRLP